MAETLLAGFITVAFFATVMHYMQGRTVRRLVGYPLVLILFWHVGPLLLFFGAPTLLLQAELAGVFLTAGTMLYRKLFGWERYRLGKGWCRYAGWLTRFA